MVEWKKFGEPADRADIELYDYEAELPEARNLAAEKPEVVKKLRALLEKQGEALARPGKK